MERFYYTKHGEAQDGYSTEHREKEKTVLYN